MNKIPETAININDHISVDLDEKKLYIWLLKFNNYLITLDKKVLPDLVDALIELQNRKED